MLSRCDLPVSYCVLLSSGIFGVHLVFGLIIEEEESFVNFFCVTAFSGHFSGEDFVRAVGAEAARSQGDSNGRDVCANVFCVLSGFNSLWELVLIHQFGKGFKQII